MKSATVYRDPETGHSKGFGFVVYRNQTDAEKAIERMNGNMLGARPIKVSWATRNKSGQMPTPLNYMEVYSQAPESHTTVYVGGLPSGMDDLGCRLHFEQFGKLQDVNYFPDKRYAFVRFETHEGAATAIVRTNGQTLDGSTLKCWWSKDNTTAGMPGQSAIVPFSQPPMGQPGPMYYQ
ncbi:Nucleolysin TIA-1 [Thelohanellus kitauei]|uniref:Nucleolysin TIA-1 n=1 Tax=Thelohanellus kitauei TaxID=669202 RepID=A0A0C2IAN7_THEKT|nr:Nucleolysin TIA-1 [Thelohanellus kitauei]